MIIGNQLEFETETDQGAIRWEGHADVRKVTKEMGEVGGHSIALGVRH
jgi:hypothetical protein